MLSELVVSIVPIECVCSTVIATLALGCSDCCAQMEFPLLSLKGGGCQGRFGVLLQCTLPPDYLKDILLTLLKSFFINVSAKHPGGL